MPTWPLTLPQVPLQDGYQETPPKTTIRQEMDTGPAYVRQRFTSGVRIITWSQIFSPEQLDIFDSFYVTDCECGALSISFPDPRSGDTVLVRIVEQPIYAALDQYYKISFKIEVLP